MRIPIIIENSKHQIHFTILENGLKLSTIDKSEIRSLMKEEMLNKLFIKLAQQIWMNPATLIAFKDLIITLYPDSNENWEGISNIIQWIAVNEFEEMQTTHADNRQIFIKRFCLN